LSNRQTEKRLTFRPERLRPPLRGRAAWAHNFNTDSSISATFRCFPPLRRQRRGASARQRAGVSRRGSKMAEHPQSWVERCVKCRKGPAIDMDGRALRCDVRGW